MKPIRIIGIGNALAGDDAMGTHLVQQFDANYSDLVDVIVAGLSGLNLLDLMDGAEAVIVIDAILSGQAPGTIHRLTIPQDLKALGSYAWSSNSPSTHSFGLAASLILANALKTLPSTVIVLGIELRQTDLGNSFSPEVNQGMSRLPQLVRHEIEAAVSGMGKRALPAE